MNERRNRRPRPVSRGGQSLQEPEVTRHSLPLRTAAPCAEQMCWIRSTLIGQTQLLTEILERLDRMEGSGR